MFLDALQVVKDGAVAESNGFETGLAPWVAGPQPAGTENAAAWVSSGAVGFTDGPGIATEDTLLWGFGLEGVTTRAERAAVAEGRGHLPHAFAAATRRRPAVPPPATYGTERRRARVGGTVPATLSLTLGPAGVVRPVHPGPRRRRTSPARRRT